MSNIIIKEVDDTRPGASSQPTDVVYVPGFANTNFNCYLFNEPDKSPDANTVGTIVSSAPTSIDFNTHNTNPEFYINAFDRKAWYCSGSFNSYTETFTEYNFNENNHTVSLYLTYSFGSATSLSVGETSYTVVDEITDAGQVTIERIGSTGRDIVITFNDGVTELSGDITIPYNTEATQYTWESIDPIYSDPYPENEPILCSSKSEFEDAFGTLPYRFYGSGYSLDNVTTPAFSNKPGGFEMYSAGDYEKSYIYARELVCGGLPVLYYNYANRGSNGKKSYPKVTDLYGAMSDMLDTIKDRGQYSVKYITSGAYPVFELSGDYAGIPGKMCSVAGGRGDATAIIDHTNMPGRALSGSDSVYSSVQSAQYENKKYGTMFTPWAIYDAINESSGVPSRQVMPASFGYLMALAKSIQTNANWLAIAGVARGVVPNIVALNTTAKLTNSIADSYQERTGVAINAITNINPYGLTIWGNRTLVTNATNLTASSFLNTRNMVNDIKKVIYTTAKSLLFEQNSEQLWLAFKSGIMPTLNKMQSGQGLVGYKIIKGTTDEKAKLVATIKLYPIYAVEDFEINVVLTDEEVTIQ